MKDRRREPSVSVPLDLGEFLCFAVYSAGLAFNRVYKPLLGQLGLTYPQYIAMVLLWERDDQAVGELGERLSLRSNTLTPLLKRLQTLGYIKRSRDPTDERLVRVRLTESGRKLRAKALHIPGCILAASGLDAKEANQLMREIASLRHTLENYNSEGSE
jgi:MarR family transcriptional regulator, organic hydroperoxide resistance regulator